MNTILLVIGLRPWGAATSRSLLTRLFVAFSVFSVEMQVVSWLGVGSLQTLVIVNALLALGALAFWQPRDLFGGEEKVVAAWRAVPWPALLLLALLVAGLNLGGELEAADPYHLDKVQRIRQSGTLAYDPALEQKINVVNSFYEVILADVAQVPLIGGDLLRLHGIFGLMLLMIGVAAGRELLDAPARWSWSVLLVVPVAFHQLVLIKNDLIVAIPSFVVLTWVITRGKSAPVWEVAWAAWLTGLVVAVKMTSFPLAIILVGSLLVERRGDAWRPLGAAVAGGAVGALAGGLVFSLIENFRVYGTVLPVEDIGDRNTSIRDVAVSIWRFVMSLVDQGLVTRRVWPGRGGWGGTFGLPFVWAILVLLATVGRSAESRRALVYAGLQFAAFAAVFPDADVAQRLALGPALLLVAMAARVAGDRPLRSWQAGTLVAVLVLSGAQILRSAWLYALRGG